MRSSRMFLSCVAGGSSRGFGSPPIRTSAPSTTFLMDLPLLRDVDTNPGGSGYYFAMTSGAPDWAGAVLFRSIDDASFAEEASQTVPASFGYAFQNALGSPRSPWTWDDENELTITMARGALSGVSATSVFNGANTLLVGDEVIQFQNAVQNMDGTYTISRLLRGRRGTEWACDTHVDDEGVVVLAGSDGLNSGVGRKPHALSILNQLGYYRGVTVGQNLTSVASQQFTVIGRDIKPYAPVHIRGERAGDDLTITWIRRTRIGWNNLAQDPVPVSEDSEAYSIDIMNGASVVRTLTSAVPTVAYSAAQQTTDFGSPQASIDLNVYQLSAQAGRGFAGSATV